MGLLGLAWGGQDGAAALPLSVCDGNGRVWPCLISELEPGTPVTLPGTVLPSLVSLGRGAVAPGCVADLVGGKNILGEVTSVRPEGGPSQEA